MPNSLLIEVPATQLAGGISQQELHLRNAGQFDFASNVDFTVIDGVAKRNGTRYVKMLGSDPGVSLRLHPIDRDGTERYLITYGNQSGVIKVYDAAGTAQTLNGNSGSVASYLTNSSATSDEIRMVSIADTTLIVNTKVATDLTDGAAYTVKSQWRDYGVMVANTPDNQTYHQTLMDYQGDEKGYFYYNTGSVTFGKIAFPIISSPQSVPSGDWDDATVGGNATRGFQIRFQRRANAFTGNATFDATTRRLTCTTSFTQYIPLDTDDVYIEHGTESPAFTTGYYRVESKYNADTVVLAPNAALPGTTVSGSCGSNTGKISTLCDVKFGPTDGTLADMYAVAKFVQDAIHNAGAPDALCSWTETEAQKGYFTITSPYAGSGTDILGIAAPSSGTDLTASGQPFYPTGATETSGTGSGERIMPVDDRWTRQAAPSDPDAVPDQTKMPVKLSRTSFGSPSTFTLSLNTWNQRTSGNSTTNPGPWFLVNGKTISDLAWFKNRLAISAGEYVAFSQAGDLFNFFQDDYRNLVDSDPIDMPLSGREVTIINFLVPFRNSLSVFAKGGEQFEIGSQDAFTPSTASVTNTTHYTTLPVVRPIGTGGLLYFASTAQMGGSGNTQLREMYYNESLVTTDAPDISAHVPRLLKATIRTIAVHQNSHTVFLLPTDDNRIYVNRSYWSGAQKVQNAWTVYNFDSSYTIRDIAVLGDELFLLVKQGTQLTLEAIPLYDLPVDSGLTYSIRLDRRFTLASGSGTYDIVNDWTTWTLPDSLSDSTLNAAVPLTGANAGLCLTPTRPANTTIRLTGDYSAINVVFGRTLLAKAGPTRPYNRDQYNRADTSHTIRLKNMTLTHASTGDYLIRQTRDIDSDVTHPFTPNSAAVPQSGTFRAWVRGDVERMNVYIESTGCMPMKIGSILYEGDVCPMTPR